MAVLNVYPPSVGGTHTTIQSALDVATDGDTVKIHGAVSGDYYVHTYEGTGNEDLTIYAPNITIVSAQNRSDSEHDQITIQYASGSSNTTLITMVAGTVLDTLKFTSANAPSGSFCVTSSVADEHYIINCRIVPGAGGHASAEPLRNTKVKTILKRCVIAGWRTSVIQCENSADGGVTAYACLFHSNSIIPINEYHSNVDIAARCSFDHCTIIGGKTSATSTLPLVAGRGVTNCVLVIIPGMDGGGVGSASADADHIANNFFQAAGPDPIVHHHTDVAVETGDGNVTRYEEYARIFVNDEAVSITAFSDLVYTLKVSGGAPDGVYNGASLGGYAPTMGAIPDGYPIQTNWLAATNTEVFHNLTPSMGAFRAEQVPPTVTLSSPPAEQILWQQNSAHGTHNTPPMTGWTNDALGSATAAASKSFVPWDPAGNGPGGTDGTPSSNTGAAVAHTGTQFVYCETSSSYTKTYNVQSPNIDATTVSGATATGADMKFRWWYHAYGATCGTFAVFAKLTSGGVGTWQQLDLTDLTTGATGNAITGAVQDDENSFWRQYEAHLYKDGSYDFRGTLFHILLYYQSGASYTGDICVDDMRVVTTSPAEVNSAYGEVDGRVSDINGDLAKIELQVGSGAVTTVIPSSGSALHDMTHVPVYLPAGLVQTTTAGTVKATDAMGLVTTVPILFTHTRWFMSLDPAQPPDGVSAHKHMKLDIVKMVVPFHGVVALDAVKPHGELKIVSGGPDIVGATLTADSEYN